jgi:hypothetical protein
MITHSVAMRQPTEGIYQMSFILHNKFKVGDIVEVTHYTPVHWPPGVKDELGTEALFQRIVGKRYRIIGFDDCGHLELHPKRWHSIWIKPEDVQLAPRRNKKTVG